MRAIATGMTTIAVLVFGSGGALASRGQIPDYLRFPAATVKQLKKDRSARVAAGSNRPVFIKVGDSITYSTSFLDPRLVMTDVRTLLLEERGAAVPSD